MDAALKTGIWRQFGAAIDMLEGAITLCPEELWTLALWKDSDDARYGQFWFIAYHTLFWLDLYLTGYNEGFAPPPPFVRGTLPENPHPKAAVRAYLNQLRSKCQTTLEGLTDEQAYRVCKFDWIEATYLEMQLYNMRHVQEHTAQLNLTLGQHGIQIIDDWVAQARDKAN